ncbi:hypothetical protein [Mucilaginibacter sp.]
MSAANISFPASRLAAEWNPARQSVVKWSCGPQMLNRPSLSINFQQ